MKTQRDKFWDTIYEQAKLDKDIIVISADMGAPALDKFRKELPSQFINTGIAEQNSILVGAGLAKEGKKVFVYAIASFLTLNCIEKIRVQCSMMNIPLNIVGVGAGFSYPDSGPTHHLIEDLGIMRSLPYIDIYSVTDALMAQKIAENYQSFKTSTYIRLERQNFEQVHTESLSLENGIAEVINGKEKLIISNGAMLCKLYKLLNSSQSNAGLLDLFKLPINEQEFAKAIAKYQHLVIVEEHFRTGGLASAVLEVINKLNIQINVECHGLDPMKGYCYHYGGRDEILKYYGLTDEFLLSLF